MRLRDGLIERANRQFSTGSGSSSSASVITILTVPIPNDSVVNLRSFVSAVLTLLSHFTAGGNKINNQAFTSGIGDWIQGSGGVLASTAGGETGNGGKYIVGGTPSTTLMSIVNGLTNLGIGKTYRKTFYLKFETNWDGGDVTITIDGQTKVVTPTASFVEVEFDLVATGTTPTVAFTCASLPTTGDILWIDTFEYTEIAGAIYNRLAGYKNVGGAVTLIGSIKSPQVAEDRLTWEQGLVISSTDVLIQGTGETDATIKWLANVYRTIVLI